MAAPVAALLPLFPPLFMICVHMANSATTPPGAPRTPPAAPPPANAIPPRERYRPVRNPLIPPQPSLRTHTIRLAVATAIGGLLGCALGALLLRVYERSLVYYLDGLGIPFRWLSTGSTLAIAATCVVLATLIGALGALYPAWRASRQEPYDLIRSEM